MAALRSDGVTVADGADGAESSTADSASDSLWPLLVAAALLVALAVVAVILGVRYASHNSSNGDAPAAQQAVLAAARGEAVALTTLGYKTANADLNRILAGATGQLRSQFEKEKGQLPATLAQTKSISRGTVLSSGLISLAGNRAQALASVDATVSGTDTGATGVIKHYRMVVTLQRVGGQWLASDVAFAGAPQ